MTTHDDSDREAVALRPCPFCGSNNVSIVGRKTFGVACRSCGARVENDGGWTRETAIAVWCSRAMAPARQPQPAAVTLPKCGTPRCPNLFAFRLSDGLMHCHDCGVVIPDHAPQPAVVTEEKVCEVATAIRQVAATADWKVSSSLAKDMARAALAAALGAKP